ncbi:MAG: hypothetical protein KDK37_12135, partial [Leptospiraceae bacterium]|nr:hypothetical protein [Leptospiraceae bacterium]
MPRRPTTRENKFRFCVAILILACSVAIKAESPGPAQPAPENQHNPGQINNEISQPSPTTGDEPGQENATPGESDGADPGTQDGPSSETSIDSQPIQLKSTSFQSLWAYLTGEFRDVLEATGWSALLILSLLLVIWLISFLFQKIYSR